MQLDSFQFSRRFLFVRTVTVASVLVCVSAHGKLSDAEMDVFLGAFDQESNEQNAECAYTQTVRRPKANDDEQHETIVSRFNPVASPESPWQVLSVDDRPPTQVELKDLDPNEGHPALTSGVVDRKVAEKLTLVSKEDDIWRFEGSFKEMSESLTIDAPIGGLEKRLKLVIEVYEPSRTLRAVKVELKKPFRFRFIIKITKIEFALLYGLDPNVGGLVFKEIDFEMQARALGRRISSGFNRQFSDFDCSGVLSDSEGSDI